MKLTLKLKPSMLGQYYEKHCDKFLIYNSVSSRDYRQLGWVAASAYEQTASALAGEEWEQILLQRLKEDDSCEVIDLKESDRVSLAGTVAALKRLSSTSKPVYLYQACLSVTPSFASKYLAGVSDLDMTAVLSDRMYPDFLLAEFIHSEGRYRITVIDAKNASFLKVGAEIQIALYGKLLKCILEDEGITNCYVNETEGIVWNREKITDNRLEHVFQLRDASAEVEEFFSAKLVELCRLGTECRTGSQLQRRLDYRISQKCEYCDNFETCKNYCIDEGNVRLMPYMSGEAQNRLRELMESGALADDTLASVKALLEQDPDTLTDECHFWKTVKNNFEAYEQALLCYYDGRKDRFPKNGTSVSFPISQNFALLLTAQQDANSGRNYAYAWLLKPGKGLDIWDQGLSESGYVPIFEGKDEAPGKGTYYDSVVAAECTPEEFDRVDRCFVEGIYELFRRIDAYPDVSKHGLQCFVMDDYESYNIESALYHMLEYLDPVQDQDLLDKVMTLLFWLQGERLVTDADLQPEECVDTPVTVLTTEISRLYVLPEAVAYGFRETASIFSPEYNFDTDQLDFFGPLSNVLEGIHIIHAWNETNEAKKKIKTELIASHLRKRLFVESAVIAAIQNDNRSGVIHLGTWPMRYRMQQPRYPEYPEIARLDFENRFEQLLTYHQILQSRAGGVQEAIDKGAILWLEYTGSGNSYRILNHEEYIGREWFAAWLCEDTPENRLQVMLLRDTRFTGNQKLRFSKSFAVMGTDTVFYPTGNDQEYDFSDDGSKATVEFVPRDVTFRPVRGRRYLFFDVYLDLNSPKTAEGIEYLVGRRELLDPKAVAGDTGLVFDDAMEEICSRFWSPDRMTFSFSQKKAFIHLLQRRLTVLVGPPASGKTDFIARALITLCCYYQTQEGRKLKVMVSANSHSAIENVLLKLDKMLKKSDPCGIRVCKTEKFDDEDAFRGTNVTLWERFSAAGHLSEDEIQIVGMTSWSAYNEFYRGQEGPSQTFDLIVMDEASQVRAMDAFLDLECSDHRTRFLLVGDDDQLPPIIGGKYRETEGEKFIHGSIFRMYLTGLGENHPDIVRLSDNFRMNGILCRYPSIALYGPEYRAYNDAIRDQRISLRERSGDALMASLLDEEYPLVFCELSGISREQNAAEVELVTRLVHELWNLQTNGPGGALARDAGNFWRDVTLEDGTFLEGACGIITPHHEHINRLKTSISADLGLERREIFIGTVDKLQGKERKTVIVSYGVSDSEKIMGESEFIFSSNRFNVSITRGKAKTIIFLSDVIAEPNLSTNILTANDPALRKGVEFIHGFSAYMKEAQAGEDLVTEEYPYVLGEANLKVWKKRLG
ncbi:MAG: AAA family ATPase [Lachnospiraceae bacterium]|nr:AAA family ATPase [Lachnospiraceae bacterium]